MARPVKLDSSGIARILKSAEMRRVVEAKADEIAQNIKDQAIRVGGLKGDGGEIDLPVTVTMSTTDRAHANVTLAHPAGQAVQAKHGALTKAAAQAGLDVKGKP